MVHILSTNITSPLAYTTEQNYQAVCKGCSMMKKWEDWHGRDPFVASLFTDGQTADLAIEGMTRFESLVIHSINNALVRAREVSKDGHEELSFDDDRTLFVLATTKADVENLGSPAYLSPVETAQRIARHLGIKTKPLIVSNACVSGLSAQLIASRMIEDGCYDRAIVCGADCISPFIVSGFQSFKALSAEPCRPFDIERIGLNLGEAAATMVLVRDAKAGWNIKQGVSTNDAYHLSAPSPTADGMVKAIQETLGDAQPSVISVHGTATMFNDQMESKAISQLNLSNVPLSALKGYYGHTMGAAGVLESILTMRALEDGHVLPSRGYEVRGVSGKVNISADVLAAKGNTVLKIISGFGGNNAAMLYEWKEAATEKDECGSKTFTTNELASIDLPQGTDIVSLYKEHIGGYAKFYKMDKLSQLAFVAVDMLLRQPREGEVTKAMPNPEQSTVGTMPNPERSAVILFNRSSSIQSDRKHLASLLEDGLTSPSVFVYTLPNIMAGEIAIRHHIKGETSLYLIDEPDERMMNEIITATISHSDIDYVITGWIEDCAKLRLIQIER